MMKRAERNQVPPQRSGPAGRFLPAVVDFGLFYVLRPIAGLLPVGALDGLCRCLASAGGIVLLSARRRTIRAWLSRCGRSARARDLCSFAYMNVLQRLRYKYFDLGEKHGELSPAGRAQAAGLPRGRIIMSVHHYGMGVLVRWVKERGGYVIRNDPEADGAADAGGKRSIWNRWQTHAADRLRDRYGPVTISPGARGMIKAVRLLRERHDVIVFQDVLRFDRNGSDSFLGAPVQWPIGVVRLATLSGSPIMLAKAEYESDGWHIRAEGPLELDEAAIMKRIEDAIRLAPWDWTLMERHVKSVRQHGRSDVE